MNRTPTFRIVVVVLVLAVAMTAVWASKEKVHIEIKNKAKSNGTISFTLTPAEGESKEIEVGVVQKTHAEEIARDVMKQFTLALGDDYKVKVSSRQVTIKGIPKTKGEKVLFDVVLSGNSVSGVSVVIK